VSQGKIRIPTEVDLSLLASLAQDLGQSMPRTKFITAPEINQIALQSVFLKVQSHPFVRWVLTEGFFLHTNKALHGIDDILRGAFMAKVVQEAAAKEKELMEKESER